MVKMKFFNGLDDEYQWYIDSINVHRINKHISLDDLSNLTGIDKANLSRIFNYKHIPSVKNLMKILDALDLRISAKYGYLYPFM